MRKEKKIQVVITDIEKLVDTYNIYQINKNLLRYIIEKASSAEDDEKINICISNKTKVEAKKLILDGLTEELNKSKIRHHHINKLQLIYFMLGIISIFLSLFIKIDVIEEIILIGGWVFTWSAIELEITASFDELRKRKIIKKLLKSNIEETEL